MSKYKTIKIRQDVYEKLEKMKNGKKVRFSDIIDWAISQSNPKNNLLQKMKALEEDAILQLGQYSIAFQCAYVLVNKALQMPPDRAETFAVSCMRYVRAWGDEDDT